MKTTFDKWTLGEIGNFGSFQTCLFNAFRLADNGNRQALAKAFPDWFTASKKYGGYELIKRGDNLYQIPELTPGRFTTEERAKQYIDDTEYINEHRAKIQAAEERTIPL